MRILEGTGDSAKEIRNLGCWESKTGELFSTREEKGLTTIGRGASVSDNSSRKLTSEEWPMRASSKSLWKAHNRPVACGTGFAFMPDEQVLKHGMDAFVFLPVQFRVFVE